MFNKDFLIKAFMEGFMPLINLFFLPLFLWVIVPGGILWFLTGREKTAYYVGAFIGLLLLFKLGPFSN